MAKQHFQLEGTCPVCGGIRRGGSMFCLSKGVADLARQAKGFVTGTIRVFFLAPKRLWGRGLQSFHLDPVLIVFQTRS